jgi:hypothetical protein
MGWTGSATKHRGKTRMQRIIYLLRADEMNVTVKPARRQNMPLSCNGLGSGADNDIDIWLGVRITGLADGSKSSIF